MSRGAKKRTSRQERARYLRRKLKPSFVQARRARDRRREKQPQRKAKYALRRARKKQALATLTPAEHQRIVAIYAEAMRRTAETGIVHHVDHDVPLALGGKHHPDNLLVVPAAINLAKGAKYASMWDFVSS